jgi:glycosyltransferase involved in cell wall biosynthesis
LHETIHVLATELVGIDSEVIIVDNGSTDGCQDAATIKNPVNLGISKGKNQGIDASTGEYIMMIDGDVVPVPNSIRCLMEYMEGHPDIDALGFYPDKWARNKTDFGLQEYCHKLDPVEEFITKDGPGWCCYYGMYRRSCFDKGLRFDENYGPGYGWEDCDFAMQMDKLGIKQWVAGINQKCGKYYHAINSSIRVMGMKAFSDSTKIRDQYYKNKWFVPAYA